MVGREGGVRATGRAVLRDVPLDRFFHPGSWPCRRLGHQGQRHPSPVADGEKEGRGRGRGRVPRQPGRDEIDGVPCFALHPRHPGGHRPGRDRGRGSGDHSRRRREETAPFRDDLRRRLRRGGRGGPAPPGAGRSVAAGAASTCSVRTPPSTPSCPFATICRASRIALISHSGHQGRHIWQGQEIGIPMSHWAPTGNEVDLEFADFVRYFADQPEVGAIAAYIEGFKDGAHRAAGGRPRHAPGGADRAGQGGPDRAGRVDGHVAHRPIWPGPTRWRRPCSASAA